MRVVVAGATGRTGREVVTEATDRGHDVTGIARSETRVSDTPVQPASDLADLLEAADILIDFTVSEATREHTGLAADASVPVVVGTTGFDDDGIAALRAASTDTPILKASNFARGVHALVEAVEAAVSALPEYDIELTETHHNGKRDAPSGTANTILETIDDARADDLAPTYGRHGDHPRTPNEVGVHARRAGTIRGEHELLVADNDEVLTITHRAESRRVFAAGAVDAAEWLTDQPPGWYSLQDAI